MEETRYAEIRQYAEIAKAVYLDHPELGAKYGRSVFVSRLAKSRVQLALINDPSTDIQWIAIRGTANPKNIFVDGRAKVKREPRLGVYLHGGFLRAAHEAYDTVTPRLNPDRQIRITGHSLGGAVAVILAALLAEDDVGYRLGRTVTFGQPMVTDSNGAKLLAKYPLLRVVNQWDPVVILPLILFRTHFEFPPTFFFHHFGPQLILYRNRKPKYSIASKFIRIVFGLHWIIAHHFVDLYLQRLQKLD